MTELTLGFMFYNTSIKQTTLTSIFSINSYIVSWFITGGWGLGWQE